ncbi:Zinc-type alcohol dehydrogenase [Hyphodiscus hymeniophilus]|uniref:Zinc-type alcohol dehydrogenase n=1 Tax=Hyphodiscus hymeniophilus TaxID=353542 RepID=A0A9P6VQS6_9HELO|nr:Zinc-type alcohol dehydrogenase [Hyphodiscus hymeniophilus]
MTPLTRTALRRSTGSLVRVVEPVPIIGTTDVLIRVKAVALNWKDAAILNSKFPWPNCLPTGIHGLGQQADGTLTDYVVIPVHTLVKVPSHLSWEEASTIGVAGLTAWNALNASKSGAGKTALLQGTGGVSLFALRLAQELGFRVIITSSSDEKLERAKRLGAALTINYQAIPKWEDEAMRMTGDVGVDLVVDQGGAATLLQSVSALKKGGRVSQVGLLTSESRGSFVPLIQMLIMKACCIQGIQVGTKSDLMTFCDFLEATKLNLTPIIDRVFDFDDTTKALQYLTSGNIFGKVVIRIP